jgi:MFS family permease
LWPLLYTMEQKNIQRISLSSFFFLSGFCFSSWASRIPTIKTAFGFNDAELGTILLSMPVGALVGLPISGWLVSKFDSRIPLSIAFFVHAVSLSLIGIALTPLVLIMVVTLFAFSMRILNIAMNTQSITLQKHFQKKINGSFHGLWSTGGILGVGVTTFMVAMDVSMQMHLFLVSGLAMLVTIFCYRFLLRNDRSTSGNKLVIGKPDPYIFYLGLLIFFAAICEGGMFDWSGIYFKEVVKVDLFTSGYLVFMVLMAFSRFISDRVIEKIGMARNYVLSSIFIVSGISLAILFPGFWTAILGFSMVGFGTAAIIPMTFLLAGASKKYSPGIAISIIATYGMAGMLLGPPLIGYLAHAFSLKMAFLAFAIAGFMLIPVSKMFFKVKQG